LSIHNMVILTQKGASVKPGEEGVSENDSAFNRFQYIYDDRLVRPP
jgi:hypothetical protein